MQVPQRVVLATSQIGLTKDVDLGAMLGALRELGIDADAAPWDAPGYDWAACRTVVIRSTWDYGQRLGEYLSWVERVSSVTRLCNPAAVVRWSSDKHYLRDLAERGVPTVPTAFIAPGQPAVFPEAGDFVVKPTVSAGARNTARYTQDQAHVRDAARHVEALHAAAATAMVQPYLPRISEGERALVFLGGAFSHAVRKGPVLTDTAVIDNARVTHPDLAAYEPSPAEFEVARAALGAVPAGGPLLYARVDLALGADGAPVVMELELIEPNLFVGHGEGGLRRFAQAVARSAGVDVGVKG